MPQVSNNAALGRYELATDDDVAFAAYERDGDVVTFTHTIVPPEAQGQGVASALIAGALHDVREHGWTFVPQCSFVADYVARHPEVRDLLAP